MTQFAHAYTEHGGGGGSADQRAVRIATTTAAVRAAHEGYLRRSVESVGSP